MKTVATLIGITLMLAALQPSPADAKRRTPAAQALARAGGNHAQIEAALLAVPHELTWLMTDTVITDFFWLQTKTPGKDREIDATCRGNKITVSTTSDVKSAAVLLDSRLVDLSVPIDLTVNGKHSEVRLTPSLRTLCETLKERGDPERAFTVRVELGL